MKIVCYISFIFILFFQFFRISCLRTSISNYMADKNDILKVSVQLPNAVEFGQHCEINVEIVNVSNSLVVVNKRLSVGYRESLSRELFVSIFATDSDNEAGIQKVLYERPFSTRMDFIQIKPGEKIAAKFNLFDWYEIPKSGIYNLVVCYQADEELAFKPEGVVEGLFCSEKKTINFKPLD